MYNINEFSTILPRWTRLTGPIECVGNDHLVHFIFIVWRFIAVTLWADQLIPATQRYLLLLGDVSDKIFGLGVRFWIPHDDVTDRNALSKRYKLKDILTFISSFIIPIERIRIHEIFY